MFELRRVEQRILSRKDSDEVEMLRSLRGTLAILCNEAGEFEQALKVLDLIDSDDGDTQLESLIIRSSVWMNLGRLEDALSSLDAAVSLARGPKAERISEIHARRAAILSACHRSDEARGALRQVLDVQLKKAEVVVPFASAVVNLLATFDTVPDEVHRWLRLLIEPLQSIWGGANDPGPAELAALALTGILIDAVPGLDSSAVWKLLAAGTKEVTGHPSPLAALRIAEGALAQGPAEFLSRLEEAARALQHAFGANSRLELTQGATTGLSATLHQLVDEALDRLPAGEELRAVAELNRDVLGRVFSMARRQLDMVMPTDSEVAQAVRSDRPVAVLEWVATSRNNCILITSVPPEGSVTTSRFDAPLIDLPSLRDALRWRIGNWYPGKRSNPLDLTELTALDDWVQGLVEQSLPDGGHLVVIEDPRCPGIPWQLITRARWSVSIAPSWSSITPYGGDSEGPVGLVVVPKHGEDAANLDSLDASRRRTEILCQAVDRPLCQLYGVEADLVAVRSLFQTAAVAKLVCHGVVDTQDQSVAWTLAYEGDLPLGHSHAASSARGRKHRLRWQDCQDLNSAPRTIWSGACSSAFSHTGGHGERLSLFSALRRAGTLAVVAPMWDVIPSMTLPILDDAFERFMKGEGLASAVWKAGVAAQATAPPWVAWSLSIEGDWR
jgi:tetratricopeptide (TPR) repeat protein